VTRGDLWLLAGLDALTLALLAIFYKELVATTFDETFAAVQGVPVRWLSTLLLVLVGAAVVTLLPVVGLLLVLAQLTIPPLIGLELCRSLRGILLTAIGAGLAVTLGGLWLSYLWDAPSGPCIIVLGALALLLVRGSTHWRRRRARAASS
ncbi:MAG: metal ABC transporter permease, partial [Acidobacteria bacterium]|nr:metal ABC transporter permease [Acidobacteriota bacterium]